MEKNTKEYNSIKERFEKCLNESNYKFKYIDFGEADDDINYEVSFNGSKILKTLGSLSGLMYANIIEHSVTLIIVKIYSIREDDDIAPFYELVNDVNNSILHGKFSVRKDTNQIIYSASIDCGEDFRYLDKEKLQILIDDFSKNMAPLLIAILKIKK